MRSIRELRGIKSNELCRMLDVASGTVSRWETSDRNPDFETLKKIATLLKTSVAYLMGELDDPTPFLVCGVGEAGWQLGEDITELPNSHKTRVASARESNVKINNTLIEVPLLTIANAASCGAGNGLYGVISESTENIFVERQAFNYIDETRKPFAVPIEGDSMIGAGLEEGANAVINPADEVLSGDTALVCLDGNWLIKWIVYNPDGSVDLKPANPNYKTTHIETAYTSDPSWFRIIGKVVRIVNTSRPKRAF